MPQNSILFNHSSPAAAALVRWSNNMSYNKDIVKGQESLTLYRFLYHTCLGTEFSETQSMVCQLVLLAYNHLFIFLVVLLLLTATVLGVMGLFFGFIAESKYIRITPSE